MSLGVYHIGMVYIYIGKNRIKILALTKSILGQYTPAYFQKIFENDLLEEGRVKNADVLSSAIKEALTLASPKEITDKQIFLILPQESFDFRGYDVPPDISETAILPFIKDKVRADIPYDIEEGLYDFLITKQGGESKVLFYSQKNDVYKEFSNCIRLLNLSIVSVFPETLSYYKLFEKTLKKDKKENIVYVGFEKSDSFGFLYNSLGLLAPERIDLGKELEDSLKSKIDDLLKNNIKVDRVILAGEESEKVRQDHFTKNVGAWTNPLKKIISTFYKDYLKLIIVSPEYAISLLDFSICIGAFIFDRESGPFAPPEKNKVLTQKVSRNISIPKFNLSLPVFEKRDLLIFFVSFLISFSIIFYLPSITKLMPSSTKKESTPGPKSTPTASPLPSPTKAPTFKKETLKIKILNGSGVAGKASDVKDILKEKGYDEILTGNADSFEIEASEIQVKDELKAAADAVKKDLSEDISIKKVSSLAKDSTADLIIIVGSDFK